MVLKKYPKLLGGKKIWGSKATWFKRNNAARKRAEGIMNKNPKIMDRYFASKTEQGSKITAPELRIIARMHGMKARHKKAKELLDKRRKQKATRQST